MTSMNMTAFTSSGGEKTRRQIILHYHFFKNAGTSLDHALKAYFGDTLLHHESASGRWPAEEVEQFIIGHPTMRALSSHTAMMPLPIIDAADIHPLLFIRHPIERIRSVYEFQQRQDVDNFGTQTARANSFAGFVQIFLDRVRDRSIRNFHVYRLSFFEMATNRNEADRAFEAVAMLPFVGIVERYTESVQLFQHGLQDAFPGISLKPVRINVTDNSNQDLEARLSAIHTALGGKLYDELVDANSEDLRLYSLAVARHEAAIKNLAMNPLPREQGASFR